MSWATQVSHHETVLCITASNVIIQEAGKRLPSRDRSEVKNETQPGRLVAHRPGRTITTSASFGGHVNDTRPDTSI